MFFSITSDQAFISWPLCYSIFLSLCFSIISSVPFSNPPIHHLFNLPALSCFVFQSLRVFVNRLYVLFYTCSCIFSFARSSNYLYFYRFVLLFLCYSILSSLNFSDNPFHSSPSMRNSTFLLICCFDTCFICKSVSPLFCL